MKRLLLLVLSLLSASTMIAQNPSSPDLPAVSIPAHRSFNVVEATIADLRNALDSGAVTSKELVAIYFERIARYEPQLNAVITLNQQALVEAEQLDRERAQGHVRSPLHGIPVGVKDIINTTHMQTTGGGLAFVGFTPPYEATLVTILRGAGAIIIGKTTLTEFANWVSSNMPGGYSAAGGYGMNPYDPRPDPRPETNDGRPALGVGGSSSGIGTAANFWVASVGTETSGSILSPSNANMLVGIKPTLGRISRYGIAPITADQDTAGPMARTVLDAAILLGAMEGASPDPHDPATNTCTPPPGRDYTRFATLAGLRGKRIGVPRANYYNPTLNPATGALVGGITPQQLALAEEAIAILKREGAVVVDPANIPSVIDGTPANNILPWGICSGLANGKGQDANCSTVFKYGMKRDFNIWLGSLGAGAPVKTLTELRTYNLNNRPRNAIKYDQAQFDISDEMDLLADLNRYQADRAKDLYLSRTHGLDEAISVNQLDALLFPGVGSAAIAARAGHPTIVIPFGFVPNAPTPAFPAGFDAKAGPYGMSFTGVACSEPKLIEIGYAFEQATKRRVPPPQFP